MVLITGGAPRADSLVNPPLTQNFDTIGSGATAILPGDFRVDKQTAVGVVGSYAAAGTATALAGGTSLSGTASNGIYNFGASAATTDRAVGFLSSSSGTKSGNLYARITNATGTALQGLNISYNVEKYRGGTNPAGFRIQLFYSTDGTAWTSAGDAFKTAFASDASNSGYTTAPGTTVGVSGNLTVAIADGADLYLAWNYSVASGTTTTNAQALAVDDISIAFASGTATGPEGTPTASPANVLPGETTLLTVAVRPGTNPTSSGIIVTADLTALGGSASQQFYDDASNGDAAAGDNVFSYRAAVAGTTPSGNIQIPVTIGDAQQRTGTATLTLSVAPPLAAIHAIQGPGTVSPYVNQSVTARGIVTGVKYNGFFIQAADDEIDDDLATSEAVFVYTGSTPSAEAVVHNRVQVSGTVSEYKNTATDPDGLSMTELSPTSVTLLSTGNELPAAISLPAADLDPAAWIFALERYEGMRVHLDQVVSVSPTDGTVNESAATSVSKGLFFAVLPGAVRPFREEGIQTPLPVPPEAQTGATPPTFDANPERIGVDTYAVFLDPATAKVSTPPAGATLEVTTNVTVTGVTGPLDYAYRSYIIDTEGWAPPVATTPNLAFSPVRPRAAEEFTVASMNLARFFDTANDPNKSDAVLTGAAFETRLAKASMAIRHVLRSPDIIGVEEMENLATLQVLAARVNADAKAEGDASITYAAFLEEGNDIGGIDVGFLVRTDKVTVKSVEQYGKDSTYVPPGATTPSILNDRPSLILHAEIQNPPYDPYPIAAVVNHLKAMTDIDGADGARVRAKRLAQAVELAGKLQALQAAGEHVISVGDYNAFEVNDGYVDVMGLLSGIEAPADRVTLWAPSPVTPPLFDLSGLASADQRYSLLFDGNAQQVDHILASADVKPTGIEYGRMNADFPESLRGIATRPERLSDHDPIVGYFSLPDIDTTAPTLTLPAPIEIEGNATGGALVTYTASAFDAVDGNLTPVCSPASGSLFAVGQTTVTCTAVDAHGNRASGSFTVTVTDTTSPVINSVSPSTATLWSPNHKPVPVSIRVTATDIVDATPACHITGVSGDDNASPADWLLTGPLTLQLAAERQGKGNGRTYTIGVQCADASGNVSATRSTTVFVPHDQRK